MGHADLKSMEPYQHQELEPLRVAINQRNPRKVWSGFGKRVVGANEPVTVSCLIDWEKVVDAVGIEPTTSRLRVECSTS